MTTTTTALSLCTLAMLMTTGRAQAAPNVCTGAFQADAAFVLRDASGAVRALGQTDQGLFVNRAECECDTHDLELELTVTQPLPEGTAATAEVWVGTACDDPARRELFCERIASPSVQALWASGEGVLRVPVPSRTLFSPRLHLCSSMVTSHSVYLIVFTDPTAPLAVCSLSTEVNGALPSMPTGVTAEWNTLRVHDVVPVVVVVSWTPPADGSYEQYDVVCARDDGSAEQLDIKGAKFSACVDGTIVRRSLTLADGTRIDPVATGGASDVLAPARPYAVCGHSDGYGAGALAYVDPTVGHRLSVVHVDEWGNGTASAPVSIGPKMTSGCSVGGRGAVATPAIFLLLVVAVAARRRATHR